MNVTNALALGGALLSLAGFIACGGNVVVDPIGSGNGGASSSTSSGMGGMGQGGEGAGCQVPSPIGMVVGCSGAATVGSGQPSQCDLFFCDQANNTYDVQCTGNVCNCLRNSEFLCDCTIQGSGDVCAGRLAADRRTELGRLIWRKHANLHASRSSGSFARLGAGVAPQVKRAQNGYRW